MLSGMIDPTYLAERSSCFPLYMGKEDWYNCGESGSMSTLALVFRTLSTVACPLCTYLGASLRRSFGLASEPEVRLSLRRDPIVWDWERLPTRTRQIVTALLARMVLAHTRGAPGLELGSDTDEC